jgi:hypothetical protein
MGREREEVEAEPQRSHIVFLCTRAFHLSALIFSLYPGYRTTKGSKEPEARWDRTPKLSGKSCENSPKWNSRYTYPLRTGDRKNLVDRKASDQANWRVSAYLVDTTLEDTEP